MSPSNGLNTIIGYATAAILAISAAATVLLNSLDQTSVPPWVVALLITLSALGERVTGLSRVSQVNTATKTLQDVTAGEAPPTKPTDVQETS